MNIYFMINWFFLCSLLGYLLECVVLTCENRTPVINRGFGHGPFCIIYGFGALGANLLLSPLANDTLKLYFAAMTMATFMELVTARAMIRLFGSFWWDYSKKKFNYKGIICLESSLAWGLLGIIYFRFLNGFLLHLTGFVPERFEKRMAVTLVLFYVSDFLYCLWVHIRNRGEEQEPMIGRLSVRS
ncbi:MAG: putative ABC transporter permease [Hungatella sp.]|nr:putative ABC transporter permease [Hungatella sp.]